MANIAPLQVPLINGAIRSFGHVVLNAAGMDFTGGVLSIDYDRTRERERVYTNNPDPVGDTLGENKYTGEMEVLFDFAQNFIQTVQQQLGPGYGDQFFTVFVSYTGTNLQPITDVLQGCKIDSMKASNKKGTTALSRTIKLNPLKILFQQIDDLANPLQAPPQ